MPCVSVKEPLHDVWSRDKNCKTVSTYWNWIGLLCVTCVSVTLWLMSLTCVSATLWRESEKRSLYTNCGALTVKHNILICVSVTLWLMSLICVRVTLQNILKLNQAATCCLCHYDSLTWLSVKEPLHDVWSRYKNVKTVPTYWHRIGLLWGGYN